VVLSVFFIVLLIAFAAIAFFTEPSKTDKRIHSRLFSMDRQAFSSVEDDDGIVKEVTFSTIPAFDRFLRSNPIANQLQLLIEQADLNWTVGRFFFATLTCTAAGAAIGNWWIGAGALGWLPGLALGAAPYVFLLQKRKFRLRRFASLLPGAIDLMSRSLRAGQALPAALELVAAEIGEPLGSEFRRAADEQSFGLPFREAMLNLSRRMQVPDLQFMITAILVQKETGGNLAQILDKTSALIRERLRVQGTARVRTAQGRLTGWILCALPIVLYIGMNVVNPGYGKILFESPFGIHMVEIAVVLMIIGMLIIRRIVDIQV
jgi:tight adherence protein B